LFLGYKTKDIALYSPSISSPLSLIGKKYEQWKQRIVESLDLPNTFPFIMLHAYFKLSVCRISTVDKETFISSIKIIDIVANKLYLMKKLNFTWIFFSSFKLHKNIYNFENISSFKLNLSFCMFF
jgi:hypothetical protein